jgi:hypothetical protein
MSWWAATRGLPLALSPINVVDSHVAFHSLSTKPTLIQLHTEVSFNVVQQSATMLALALLLSLLCALAMIQVSAQSDCQGKVGAYAYDLRPLAGKIGNVDLQAT